MWDIIITLAGFATILLSSLYFFEKRMYRMVDSIGDIFSGILTKPTVSKAFGILGSKSAESQAQSKIVDQLATDILSGPKFAALKQGGKFLGIDIDEYIEENGAMNTIASLQQLGGALGIDVNALLAGGGDGTGSVPALSQGGHNPYF